MGDEMILELAASLNAGMEKTAAKKDDDKEDKKEKKEEKCKCGKKDCDCGCKGDADKCKCKKEEKKDKDDKKEKKDAMMDVLTGLSKLAADLDEVGAEEASSLVDDALKVIVHNLENEKKK
jgi:hypothetical protein